MARIAGVDLPRNERVEIGLTRIFGIGRTSSRNILSATGVDPSTRVRDLKDDDVLKIRNAIDRDYKVEGDLRRDVTSHIKRLMDIGCYRGLRHRACTDAEGDLRDRR